MSALGEGPLTSIALCWRIERKDGAGLALTSHDQGVVIDRVRYDAAPGMTPATVRHGGSLDPQKSEIAGAISSDSIGEEDLIAGRWDGAAVRLAAVNWAQPTESEEMASGELGRIAHKGQAFHAELMGPAARLDAPICPYTSPECRAELGDQHCRVDMTGRSVRARVLSVDGMNIMVDVPLDDRFMLGSMRFLSGKANGIRSTILKIEGAMLTLRSLPPLSIAAGDVVVLVEGCDKRLATCSERFANAENFRGEPHLPGNDLLTRYPGV